MATMAKIFGFRELIAQFKEFWRQSKRQCMTSVIVGYTAAYAIYVHENTLMKLKGKPRPKVRGKGRGNYWDPQGRGQAKFLEQPAREMREELGRVVKEVTMATKDIRQGLLAAGFRLQRESQRLVPVNTGNLKNSAFTREEKL